ncbi:hypothetical protein [Bradyrhizobium sp. URHD0069]|uniref:hypothetical protein n=1 Tax=Bradyrhizobium sp. URHD0069 TaxID=1380355 RepID=UPI0004965F29|nr:hypothetical protein [Bradyrhizobium sp. URHD0069]
MIDPAKVCLFIPAGLKDFKLDLFERIGSKIEAAGGRVVRHDIGLIDQLPNDIIPIVGCQPESTPLIAEWRKTGRQFVYWDRGYARRVFATWLPRGSDGGYYRWHLNAYQMQLIRNVPSDRWDALKIDVKPWQRNGRHIVIAAPTRTYSKFHQCENWIAETIDALARVTDRQLVIRDKESKRSLQSDLEGAHCLVTHASIAAVEAVILGCPVYVHPDSAAALVGQTDLSKIEKPVYPDRDRWLWSLAASQWNEQELVDGTLWQQLA